MFPELRPYLDDVWKLAKEAVLALDSKERAKVHVITRYRDANSNLRTQLERIIARAGLKPWPKLFQNLRATRATELAAEYPAHVAADCLGHSTMVAQKHYWRTTDADFDKATSELPEALHEAVQSASVSECSEPSDSAENLAMCGISDDFEGKQHARQDSNLRPAD